MTITEAVSQLIAADPKASFSVGLDVWAHYHEDEPRGISSVEWTVYNAETKIHCRHPTLEGAVAQVLAALNTPPPRSVVREAEKSVGGFISTGWPLP